MIFFEKLLIIIFFIPIAAMLLYSIFYPRDFSLWGKRWQFKNPDLEPSEELIKYNRNAGIVMLVICTIIFLVLIFTGC